MILDDAQHFSILRTLYFIFIAAILIALTPLGFVVALLIPVVGGIYFYQTKLAPSAWQRTHTQYMLHTFWYGLVAAAAGGILKDIGLGYIIWVLLAVWWVIRCIKGIKHLAVQAPIDNPGEWFF